MDRPAEYAAKDVACMPAGLLREATALIIPIRTDSPLLRVPRVNHALVALNVVIFLLTEMLSGAAGSVRGDDVLAAYRLWPRGPELYQFITYQFLHGSLWHLAGNMLFLWVFGNSVNSKMGNLSYLLFYLACGVFAGVGFAVGGTNPLVGSSGAIAGITTAYLVLFPRSTVLVVYWFFFIGTFHMQALWFIALKIVLWDNILAPSLSTGPSNPIAYSAHLAGYLFGFVVCSVMLLIRALPRDQFDIIALAKRRYKRERFKSTMADPNARARATYGRVARPVSVVTEQPVEAPDPAPDKISRLRGEIGDLLTRHDYKAAVERYTDLIAEDPDQCLPRNNMMLVANQLMTLQLYPQAAAAYERFLKAYPTGEDAMQVRLVLGIIYAKYLQQFEAAQPYLRECASGLADPEQTRQAKQWLEAAVAALRRGPSTA